MLSVNPLRFSTCKLIPVLTTRVIFDRFIFGRNKKMALIPLWNKCQKLTWLHGWKFHQQITMMLH